jgi:Flp pilus assembly protein CpaB
MRALSIDISDGSAVSGFLNPGNYVDVIVTIEGDDTREAETVTLLQAVTVLAVNNRMGNSSESIEGRGPRTPRSASARTWCRRRWRTCACRSSRRFARGPGSRGP